VQKPDFHFLVCNSFRGGEATQGVCSRKGALDLIQYLQNEIIDRGLNAMVSSTGCLQWCEKGPVMVLYPQNLWFAGIDEARLGAILDTLEAGGIPKDDVGG